MGSEALRIRLIIKKKRSDKLFYLMLKVLNFMPNYETVKVQFLSVFP